MARGIQKYLFGHVNMPKKTNRETALKMRLDYESGGTQGTLVRKWGRSEDSVRRILRGVHPSIVELGLPDISRQHYHKLTDADVGEILELRKKGLSFHNIGKKYGVDGKTISYHVQRSYSSVYVANRAIAAAVAAKPPEPPKPQRETIFSWARKWEAEFDARVTV